MATLELMLKLYPAQGVALPVYDALLELQKKKMLQFINAALLECDEHGETSFVESHDIRPGKGALIGTVAGGLVGLLGGPAGVLVGLIAGAITGAIVAGMYDNGFQDKFLLDLSRALTTDKSAVLVLAEEKWAEEVIAELNRMPGKLFRHALKTQLIEEVKSALNEGDAPLQAVR